MDQPMNTHDIELPPMPEPAHSRLVEGIPTITMAEHMDIAGQYATAAIEADRKRRGEPVAAEIERLAANRYRPVPNGVFAYKVVAGDGRRSLFSGSKDECYVVARKLTEAFLDGAFAATNAAPQPTEPVKMPSDPAVAAIQFALATDEAIPFLHCWNEGNFDAIRREWPEAPEAVFIGADPLHPETRAVLGLYGHSVLPAEPVKADSAGYTSGPISDGGFDPRNANDRQARGEPAACFKCGHAKHDGECVNVAPQPQKQAMQQAIEMIETALHEAYDNAYQDCCGNSSNGECCGNAVQSWNEADQRIMDVLSPIRQKLCTAMLEAAPKPQQQAEEPVSNQADEKCEIAGWLRRRSDWPMVGIPGNLAGEIADHIEGLEGIIAACRDAVPLPPSGSEQEKLWPDAMSDASCVPAYIAAGFLVVRSTALAEAASVVADHNREGRQWVPGSLWGTLTNEAVARIKELSEGQVIRLQYIEGVGTVAVMEPK